MAISETLRQQRHATGIAHMNDAVIVEGTFKGTHNGAWRGLPATGRKVLLPMVIIFRFEGAGMGRKLSAGSNR